MALKIISSSSLSLISLMSTDTSQEHLSLTVRRRNLSCSWQIKTASWGLTTRSRNSRWSTNSITSWQLNQISLSGMQIKTTALLLPQTMCFGLICIIQGRSTLMMSIRWVTSRVCSIMMRNFMCSQTSTIASLATSCSSWTQTCMVKNRRHDTWSSGRINLRLVMQASTR